MSVSPLSYLASEAAALSYIADDLALTSSLLLSDVLSECLRIMVQWYNGTMVHTMVREGREGRNTICLRFQ